MTNRTFYATLCCMVLLFLSPSGFSQSFEGEMKRWHKITMTFSGPSTSETATPNPFSDYRMEVTFTHSGSGRSYKVPGYFAACGDAANNSCTSGDKWRVHFAADRPGNWNWAATFKTGNDIAIKSGGSTAGFFDGQSGSFTVLESDKKGKDFRAPDKGRLQYVNKHYLRHSGANPDDPNGNWFFKAGADAPENTLAYEDFDDTPQNKNGLSTKSWQPHQRDYSAADASAYTWKNGKGTELLGVVRYLSEIKDVNAMSFLTFSLDGDDKSVFPHRIRQNQQGRNWNEVYHDRFDVSKMAQWEKFMEYADKKGVFLHFKTQETENDQKMDGGNVGRERKLYYRELIARFGHHLALNWNLGEENTQTNQQRQDMAQFFYDHDPYHHHIVIHTYKGQKSSVYGPMLGNNSKLTGPSLQSHWEQGHGDVVEWFNKSENASKPWVIAVDEHGSANVGIKTDPTDRKDVRNRAIWSIYLGGAMGFEFYYGYGTGCTDLTCQDHRTRDEKYTDASNALKFFEDYFMPYLPEVVNADGETSQSNDYVLRSKDKSAYAIYLPNGGNANINGLPGGAHRLRWYNPRNGQMGNPTNLSNNSISAPSGDDWVAFIETDSSGSTPPPPPPPPPAGIVLEERNGVLAIEAEHFSAQSKTDKREWYLTSTTNTPGITPDPDGNHAQGASGDAYMEILSDTRVTHGDRLQHGVNFSGSPGKMAIIDYQVYINDPGKYYVWVRAYSTGTEDNGVHVGLDGNWPSTGERMQWCSGKNRWTWESKQRTNANHCGEARKIYLDINTPGFHTLSFSMREDGFEMDKIVLSKSYTKPLGTGPAEIVYGGSTDPCASNQAPSIQLDKPGNDFEVDEGDDLLITAKVSDPDNNISLVEFFANGQKVGEDKQPPYTFTLRNMSAGDYDLSAKVVDQCGANSQAPIVQGKAKKISTPPPPPPPSASGIIAFISGDAANLKAGDQSVVDQLKAMGYQVQVFHPKAVQPSDVFGKDLIYVSSTVYSNDLNSKLRDIHLPVVNCEPFLMDDFRMTGRRGGREYGSEKNVSYLDIVNNQHPIADGLNMGRVDVYNPADESAWGIPSADATGIAYVQGSSTKMAIFTYEAGDNMMNLQAPAKRVGFFLRDGGLVKATPEAYQLFENVICWAVDSCLNGGGGVIDTSRKDTQMLVLSPIEDAYLQNGRRYNIHLLRTEVNKRTAYLRFDLSNIDGTILDAQLKMTCISDPGVGPITVELGNAQAWTENNLNSNNKPRSMQVLDQHDQRFDRNQAYTWDLEAVQGGQYLNLLMNHLSGNDVAFASTESGNPDQHPQLILKVVGNSARLSQGSLVEWIDLQATPGANDLQVNWRINSEQNIQSFAIERSLDGSLFQEVGRKTSLGDTDQERRYGLNITDLSGQEETYRIKALGKDGYFSYSNILRVNTNPQLVNMKLFPNPIEGDEFLNVILRIPAPGPLTVRVLDYQGKLLQESEATFTTQVGKVPVELPGLERGIYLLQISGNGWVKAKQFVVR